MNTHLISLDVKIVWHVFPYLVLLNFFIALKYFFEASAVNYFFFFFFFVYTRGMWKSPGKGSNPSQSSDNAEYLTSRPTENSAVNYF